jgi:hypothetical protein
LRYWLDGSPTTAKAAGFRSILVYCVGPPDGDPRPRCWHSAEIRLDGSREWSWPDILTHLKCTKCGSVAWIDPRPNWTEVIDHERRVGAELRPLRRQC